jgi:hypothetical protein
MTEAQKTFVGFLLIASIASAQFLYDATKVAVQGGVPSSITPQAVRMLDAGFHAAAGSFLWVSTMPEILELFNKKTNYLTDLSYLNAVDPKLGYPYAFSVITLPAIPTTTFPGGLDAAMAIGKRGLRDADPDWRIPYYLGTEYFLAFKDRKTAAEYFDITARTPGVPYFAKRFSENFGAEKKERVQTRELWASIRDTTNNEDTKARAQAYIDRLDIFDYLEAAAAQYKKIYGVMPATPDELVQKNIIPGVPQDPFGFSFTINKDGTVTIDLTKGQ